MISLCSCGENDLSFHLDESKTTFPYDSRPTGAEKVRFDTEAIEQMKDRDGMTGITTLTSDGRSTSGRSGHGHRVRRQQSSDSSLSGSPRKKTEKIRIREALDIMEPYRARYRIRSGGESSFFVETKNESFT
jgi:hypothetical protein